MMDEPTHQPLLSSPGPSDPSQPPIPAMQDGAVADTPAQPNHCATDIKVWFPSENAQPAARPALGDEYFVPTAAEAQRAFSGQVASRERLTDGPLLTKSLREREQSQKRAEKYARFPITRIRVRFADRTMLEGALASSCTMAEVYRFVRESLTDNVRTKNFMLYQTPPRREFGLTDPKVQSTSLLDLQLTPSSLLYIKFSDDCHNHTSNPPPLLPDLLAKAEHLPPPPSFGDGPEASPSMAEKGKQKVEDVLKSGAKVPKWLQNLKKKS